MTYGPLVFRANGGTSATIQTLANAAHAAGGGVIFLEGAYTIDKSIDLRGMSNIAFIGDGATTVLTCTAALNGSDPNFYNDVFNANNLTLVYPNYMSNLSWQDMTIDCTLQNAGGVPALAQYGYNLCAIECQNVNYARFTRITVKNAFGNALVSGSIDPQLGAAVQAATIEDCLFLGCCAGILPQYGITGSVVQYGAMNGGVIRGCRFINSGGPGIDVFNCYGTQIKSNYFQGTKGTPCGAGQNINSIHSDFGLQHCTIEDNTFLEAGPILLNGLMTVTAFNVVATPGPQNCSISRNKQYGAASENVTFPHISLYGGSSAIALGSARANLIVGNNSYQSPTSGIVMYDGLYNIVSDNTIDSCGNVNHTGVAFSAFDSGQPGGGSKENVVRGNVVIATAWLTTNYSDNGANNTLNHFWDNRMAVTIGASTISTAVLDKDRNYGPGSP